jgi:osmoprotectant transport system ATP-binding protein
VIEFESVSKTFRDGTAAVVDLSLTVPSDKITVIVGPSGCGKTTTLRMVNRMLEPTSGRILWDGTPLRSKRKTTLRRQMGYVIQSGGLFPHRTVLENIGTVPGLLGWSKDKTRKRSLELLASVGLDRKLANRYPAQLSGGQQQRVGVARALAADPLVLLMDEPFSAVDPVVRSELHDFFLGLQREISKTIILITHDIDEAIKLGDQVAILRVGGRLAQVGTPQQLLEEPADAFVEGFIGKDRGFRSLSFLSADSLRLERVDVVREVESVRSDDPTLVVDGDARPLGWAHRDQPGRVVPVGSTFVPESDNLRTALDAALTSPYGLAVAVAPGTGRFAGVVSAQEILGQVADARVASSGSVELRTEPDPRPEAVDEPGEEPRPEVVEGPEDGTSASADRGADEPAELRPEPVGGLPDDDRRPDPGDGPDDEASTGSSRTGSTRLDELQLSAEPVESPAARPEPLDEPLDEPDDGSDTTVLSEEREPDRDHVR